MHIILIYTIVPVLSIYDSNINPAFIRPKMFMFRLQKIMDEYAGGVSTQATQIALAITLLWGVISAAYLIYNSRRQGKSLLVTSSPAAGD